MSRMSSMFWLWLAAVEGVEVQVGGCAWAQNYAQVVSINHPSGVTNGMYFMMNQSTMGDLVCGNTCDVAEWDDMTIQIHKYDAMGAAQTNGRIRVWSANTTAATWGGNDTDMASGRWDANYLIPQMFWVVGDQMILDYCWVTQTPNPNIHVPGVSLTPQQIIRTEPTDAQLHETYLRAQQAEETARLAQLSASAGTVLLSTPITPPPTSAAWTYPINGADYRLYTPMTAAQAAGQNGCWDVAELRMYSDSGCNNQIISVPAQWSSSGSITTAFLASQYAIDMAFDGYVGTVHHILPGAGGAAWIMVSGVPECRCMRVYQGGSGSNMCRPDSEVQIQTRPGGASGSWETLNTRSWSTYNDGWTSVTTLTAEEQCARSLTIGQCHSMCQEFIANNTFDTTWCTFTGLGACDRCSECCTDIPNYVARVAVNEAEAAALAAAVANGHTPTPDPTPASLAWLYGATGDPHITRIDGAAFDIDAVGTYSLLKVPAETGKDFNLKTIVGREHPEKQEMYNRAAEFTGTWLSGHNFTIVGQESHHVAGIYIDGELTPFKALLKDRPYKRRLTQELMVHAEYCHPADDEDVKTEFCKSHSKYLPHRRQVKAQMHNAVESQTIFADVVTGNFSAVIHVYPHHGNLELFVDPIPGKTLEDVGGLLAPQSKRHQLNPAMASSRDIEKDDGEASTPEQHPMIT